MTSTGARRGRAAVAGNLPWDPTLFVARRALTVNGLRRLLDVSRLVTLTGPSGVGKSRLAMETARSLRDCPAGWWVDLRILRSPDLLLAAVATVLDVHDDLDAVAASLRAQTTVLVLDNCEHVVGAVSELAATLLRDVRDLRILVTCHQALGTPGEQVRPVPPLTGPSDTDHTLQAAAHHEAMQLLIARATAAGYTVDDHNGAAVVELCRRLEGNPLLIELAAGQLRGTTAHDLVERLDAIGVRVLQGVGQGLAGHVPPMITSTWEQLDDRNQRLLMAVAVFADSFDLAAARAVSEAVALNAEEVTTGITVLGDLAVITRDKTAEGQRFRLPDMARAYGRDRAIATGHWDALCRSHRDHYQQIAQSAAAQWYGPKEIWWLDQIHIDQPNLLAALDFCLTRPSEVEQGWRLARDLIRSRYYTYRSALSVGRDIVDRALAVQPRAANADRASLQAMGAWVALCQGDQDAAATLMQDCRTTADTVGGWAAVPALHYTTGVHALLVNGDPRSVDLLQHAATLFGAAGRAYAGDAQMAKMFAAIGAVFVGSAEQAQQLSSALRTDAERHGSASAAAWALWIAAVGILVHGHDPLEALTLLRECLRRHWQQRAPWGTLWALEAIGWVAAAGDPARAATLLGYAQRQQESTRIAISRLAGFAAARQRAEQTATDVLGAEAYRRMFAAGAAFEEADAVAVALGAPIPTPAASGEPRAAGDDPALTPMEWRVVELLARGKTNKEIAATLDIALRTAETHVYRIGRKLGLSGRDTVSAWAKSHQNP